MVLSTSRLLVNMNMLPILSSSLRAQVGDDIVQCEVTRLLALDSPFLMTIRLGFIYVVDS